MCSKITCFMSLTIIVSLTSLAMRYLLSIFEKRKKYAFQRCVTRFTLLFKKIQNGGGKLNADVTKF